MPPSDVRRRRQLSKPSRSVKPLGNGRPIWRTAREAILRLRCLVPVRPSRASGTAATRGGSRARRRRTVSVRDGRGERALRASGWERPAYIFTHAARYFRKLSAGPSHASIAARRELVAFLTLPLRDRNAFKSGHELYQLACLALLGYSITIPGEAVEKSLGKLVLSYSGLRRSAGFERRSASTAHTVE